MWVYERIDERRTAWYRERFAPTLRPLTELGAEAVLVTHGPAVVRAGSAALAQALDRPPWYHPG